MKERKNSQQRGDEQKGRVDPEAVERIRKIGGDRLFREMVDTFVEHSSETMKRLAASCENGLWDDVGRLAHSVRSSAVNFGALTLIGLCSRIEWEAKLRNIKNLERLVAAVEEEHSNVKRRLESMTGVTARKRIAVVEDNPDNRLLVSAILGARYEIHEYENGRDALAGMAGDPPDLVLLDISLPAIDGTEVLRRIRHDETLKSLPVIALTAHAMAGDREKHLAQGFQAYVTKPILDEAALLDTIEQCLEEKT